MLSPMSIRPIPEVDGAVPTGGTTLPLERELARLRAHLQAAKTAHETAMQDIENETIEAMREECQAHAKCAATVAELTAKQVAEALGDLTSAQSASQNSLQAIVMAEQKLQRELESLEEESHTREKAVKDLEKLLAHTQSNIAMNTQKISRAVENVQKLRSTFDEREDAERDEIDALIRERDRMSNIVESAKQELTRETMTAIAQTEAELKRQVEERTEQFREQEMQRAKQLAHFTAQQLRTRAKKLANELCLRIVNEFKTSAAPMLDGLESKRNAYSSLAQKLLHIRDKFVEILAKVREGKDTLEDVTLLVKDVPLLGDHDINVGSFTKASALQAASSPNRSRSVERGSRHESPRTRALRASSLEPLVRKLQQVASRTAPPEVPDAPFRAPVLIDVDALAEQRDAASLGMDVIKSREELNTMMDKILEKWRDESSESDLHLFNFLRMEQQALSAMPRPPIIPSAKTANLPLFTPKQPSQQSVITDIAGAYRAEIDRTETELQLQQDVERLQQLVAQKQQADLATEKVLSTYPKDSDRALDAIWQATLLEPPLIELRTYIARTAENHVQRFGSAPNVPSLSSALEAANVVLGASHPHAASQDAHTADATVKAAAPIGSSIGGRIDLASLAGIVDNIWTNSEPHFSAQHIDGVTPAPSPMRKASGTRGAGVSVEKLLSASSPR